MTTLIFLFGFWINPLNISYLMDFDIDERGSSCAIIFNNTKEERIFVYNKDCDEVAKIINKRTKK